MTYLYPREKKQIITICGYYDPFDSQEYSESIWEQSEAAHSGTYHLLEEIVAAPSISNKYAIHLKGTTFNGGGIAYNHMAYSAFRDRSNSLYMPALNAFKWKTITDFRLRIVADASGVGSDLSTGTGWCLDANSKSNRNRAWLIFHVANQKVGIGCRNDSDEGVGGTDKFIETIYSQDWSGSYDTWYDVRVELEYDWWAAPMDIIVTVYVNKTEIFSETIDKDFWRSYSFTGLNHTSVGHYYYIPANQILGRSGPGLALERDGGSGGETVEAYWTDIHQSIEHKIVRWNYEDSILQAGFTQTAHGSLVTNLPQSFTEGCDIQIWKRNSLDDVIKGQFRGIIRKIENPRPKMIKWEAEGYGSVLYQEKVDELAFTAQTAGTIVQAAFNNPLKKEFDTTTFFDTTTTTYTKTYYSTPKMAILEEMAKKEGYIVFIDHGNNVHFESYRTNTLGKHLIYGQSRIRKYSVQSIFARKPNILRVVGTGVYSEKILSTEILVSNSRVVRQVNMLELTTQAEVDAEVDLLAQSLLEPIAHLELEMRADWEISKGNNIAVTIPDLDLSNRRFLVAAVTVKGSLMILNLLEAKVHLPALLSDLVKRSETTERLSVPTDTVADNPQFNTDGLATCLVDAEYEIEYNSAIVRSGKMTVTDTFIDDLLAVWNEETITEPDYIAVGSGTTEPDWNETTLETEASRTVVSKAYAEELGAAYLNTTWYRAVEFERDIIDPSGITELGLFNDASVGTMACRAAFASYSQSGTVTFRVRLRLLPKPSSTFITSAGIYHTCVWMFAGTNLIVDYIGHIGSLGFHSLHPDMCGAQGSSTPLTIVPSGVGLGTFTVTKYIEKNQINFTFEYPDYDRLAHFGGNGSNYYEFGIVLRITGILDQDSGIITFRRGHQYMDTVADGRSCRWSLWLRFEQGGGF